NSLQGLHLQIDGLEMHTRMIGEFNAYNLLAVYGAAVLLGEERTEVLTRVSQLPPAEGRFDFLVQKEKNLTGIVDYAHTPDALEKVLETLKALNREKAKIITVTGCGGDRDRTKRPIMAKIACEMSDKLILTSDNPRSENPDDIIREMEAGVPAESKSKVLSVTDRRQAIKVAVQLANPGDVILIAGKGHEKYQEIKGVKYPFDDKEELKICFEG
ncbi:MAG TPA: cyanophycin synthetase, partial [Saprospiraceae bacterium]|nr:cyanophycin synthetase [Saprospiraceae bacterium]